MSSLASGPPATVKVWDPLVRLLHWSLVLGFTVAYLSGEGEEGFAQLHVDAGYVVGGLVVCRLLWGIVGTRHARFTDFVTGPRAVLRYARDELLGRARRHLGHNPLGGAMVVALLAMLTLTTVTGLAWYGARDQAGPLAGLATGWSGFGLEALEELHESSANVTLLLVMLHIAGVLWSSVRHRENLVRAMIDGRKRVEP